jgi:hypothetical protein
VVKAPSEPRLCVVCASETRRRCGGCRVVRLCGPGCQRKMQILFRCVDALRHFSSILRVKRNRGWLKASGGVGVCVYNGG